MHSPFILHSLFIIQAHFAALEEHSNKSECGWRRDENDMFETVPSLSDMILGAALAIVIAIVAVLDRGIGMVHSAMDRRSSRRPSLPS